MKDQVLVVLLQESPEANLLELVEAGQAISLLRARDLRVSGCLVRTARQRSEVADRVLLGLPGVVFLHVGVGQAAAALALLNDLRRLPETRLVALGGAHATLCSPDFTQHGKVDAIFLGEWVESLAEYVHACAGQGFCYDVAGSLVRTPEGWHLNDQRVYRPLLDEWPDPELDEFRIADLMHQQAGMLPIHASRGFPFQSLFSVQPLLRHLQQTEFHYYMRPVERVVADAERLAAEFKPRSFLFVDELFPWPEAWLREFADLWSRKVRLPFRIRTAAEYLSEERLEILRHAGLHEFTLRLESGDERLRLQYSDINQTNRRVLEGVAVAQTLQIESHLHFMAGVPGDTRPTLKATVELARQARASRVSAEHYVPHPDSGYWVDTERALTGGYSAPRPPVREERHASRDVADAITQLQELDSSLRTAAKTRHPEAILDALSDFPRGVVRSPLESPARIDKFASPGGPVDVIALRVPAEISWEIMLPDGDTVVGFGILLRPELAGERSRLPVSFSIRLTQAGQTYRLFQKILIQALDPDSRRWHWFRVPVGGVRPGPCVLTLENLVHGQDPLASVPDKDLWAGWARVLVASASVPTITDDAPLHGSDSTLKMPGGEAFW